MQRALVSLRSIARRAARHTIVAAIPTGAPWELARTNPGTPGGPTGRLCGR
ncbi:MAG: hypothetical protein ACRDI2_23325 [Chloroflexota bacterium]